MMRFGIGMMELLILIIIFGGIATFIGSRSKRGSASDGSGPPQRHARLKNCPGCAAPLNEDLENCPHCGLRVGI